MIFTATSFPVWRWVAFLTIANFPSPSTSFEMAYSALIPLRRKSKYVSFSCNQRSRKKNSKCNPALWQRIAHLRDQDEFAHLHIIKAHSIQIHEIQYFKPPPSSSLYCNLGLNSLFQSHVVELFHHIPLCRLAAPSRKVWPSSEPRVFKQGVM